MSAGTCPICRARRADVGVACTACLATLPRPRSISPDRISAVASRPIGALIDCWGRPHLLDAFAEVGRVVKGPGLTIADLSVSRRHATITAGDSAWIVENHGSANGTLVNGNLVEATSPLVHGDRLGIAQFELIFVADVPTLDAEPDFLFLDTARAALPEEITQVGGARELAIRLDEPVGGGAGLAEIDGRTASLSLTQFELLRILVERMRDDDATPPSVRGFVRSTELISMLSWDTSRPGEEHLKQLVRRLRRTLVAAGVEDPIESRHRFGYRLAGMPVTRAVPDEPRRPS